jgi:hypothetical protein
MKILASIGLLVLVALLAMKLAVAPLYDRYNAAECREAYAQARTLADSLRIDLHPYASPRGSRNPRCGETRVRPVNESHVLSLRQPNGGL